jgi:subfamily B ATP-binding cassette protein MsbA
MVQDGMAAAQRIFEVLDTKPEIQDRTDAVALPPGFKTIEFHNVTFQYEDELVLKDINLTVRTGETIAIVGKSGGGKTTLVNLIPRFYDVTGGTITIGGVDLRNTTTVSLRAHIAIVTQQTILFNDTVRNNIAYGSPSCTMDELTRAAHAAQADEFIRALPRGYDTMIGEAGIKLSGGQRQRLSIARALLKNAPILLLDEATSSLDSLTEEEISQTIRDVAATRDAITILIAHRLSTVLHADRIYVLERGRIAESGRHDELLEKRGLYYAMWRQQVGEARAASPIPSKNTVTILRVP